MRSHPAAKPAGHGGPHRHVSSMDVQVIWAGHPRRRLPQASYGSRSDKVLPVTDLGLMGETGGSALSRRQAEASEEGRIGRIESAAKKSGSL